MKHINTTRQSISFLATILFSFFISSYAFSQTTNGLSEYNLKGKVKSVTEISYEAVPNFGEFEKGKRKREIGTLKNDNVKKFNERGNLIGEDEYNSNGYIHSRKLYSYNDKEQRVEENAYRASGSHAWRVTYKYDIQGNMIENNNDYSDSETRSIHKYDEQDNQIEKSEYYNGVISKGYTYKYDNKGNRVEENWFDSNGILWSRKTYKYDNKGNQIELNMFRADGSLSARYTNRYNGKGNKIEWISYYSDGSLSFHDEYEYDESKGFDKRGNWIRKLVIMDKIPEYIIEREIEYYN